MKRNKHWKRRFAAVLLAVALILPVQPMSRAETIEEVQARQEELRRENDELEAELERLKEDENSRLEYQAALQQKITLTEQKIDQSREDIRLMDEEIELLEAKLEASKAEYQDTIDLFAQRIKALYKTGSVGTLEILLNSDSFSDFTMRMAMVSAVTRHDQEMVDRIEEYLERTAQDRERVQAMREEEAQVKKELEEAQDELEELYAENDAVIADLEAQQMYTRETIEANEEEDAALEEELQELIRIKNEEEERRRREAEEAERLRREAEEAARRQAEENNQENPDDDSQDDTPAYTYFPPEYTELGMHEGFSPCWPLPGISVSNITGRFGAMYSNGPHKGTDIGAPYGTPIVATQAGQVLSAEYHWSWGNNVLIWHNDTYATRYAHMSSIAVSAGQYVEQGQIIGYVGATGYAFGNHLHYEVYLNGTRVAAEPYLGV